MSKIDLDRAFPKTPDCIHAAIEMGFKKGQKKMKMRNKIISAVSAAAVLAVVTAVSLGVSRDPRPDVLTQPPVTDMPKSEEIIHVYSTDGADFYHLKPDCSGMENSVEMSETEAVRMGKKACPICIPIICNGHKGEEVEYIYYSQGAKYFHKQEGCNGGRFDLKGEYFTVTRAFPGKEPCTICFPNGIEECVHERAFVIEIEPTLAPVPEEYTAVNETATDSMPAAEEYVPVTAKKGDTNIVYVEYGADGNSYHRLQNCGGRKYLREISENQAKKENFLPCSACYSGDVYYTEGGKYYHSNEHCQGMMNADIHNRNEAYTSGKLPCPTCLLVYCNEDGLYFHSLPDCMGMQFADLRTLTDAYAMNDLRCPLCLSPSIVYATKKGKYFHAEADCSGMVDASATTPEKEWENGKTPCYVCITGDSTLTLTKNKTILSETAEQSEMFIRLPEHHELFENAFGKSINTLFPGCYFSFESWDANDENADIRVWMLKNSADPNEEVFAGVIEYAPGVGGYGGYRLRVNLTDNLSNGNHVNNAHDFLRDAYHWFGDIQVSLRNLCNYAQLYFDDEMQKLKSEEHLFSVEGVMVYFDENEEVYGYDVRYRFDGKDTYVLRTTIDADGTLYWELLEGEVWK